MDGWADGWVTTTTPCSHFGYLPGPPTHPHPLLQCRPVDNIDDSLQPVVSLNGPCWEAAVLVGFLVVLRVAIYYALRTKTQR